MVLIRRALPLLLLLSFSLFAPLQILATPLADDDVVIVIRTGTNSDGTERFEVADSSDSRALELWNYSQQETSMRRVLQYYQDVQDPSMAGLSPSEREVLSFYGENKDPVYIELEEGGGGAYCDWKGRYTVDMPDGQLKQVVSPKVVVRRNDPVFTGGDKGLAVQTLVHEIGHGAMSKLYGYEKLPYTDWLQKEHAGGMVTDEKLALIEGWAEFVGAYFTDRATIANDPSNAISDNRYAYSDIYTRSRLRSASDMNKTEGWVATAYYNLVNEGALSLSEIDAVFRKKTPQTFQAFIYGVEEMYPDKSAAVRTVLADTSHGKMYKEYQTTRSSLVGSLTSGNALAGTTVASLSSLGGDKGSKMLPLLIGAVIGAIAGGPFGTVGMIVGGTVGLLIGQLISSQMESASAARTTSFDGSLVPKPAISGALNPDNTTKSSATANASLSDLRGQVNDAFKAYLEAVRQGTQAEQTEAMNKYRALQAQFKQQLQAGQN